MSNMRYCRFENTCKDIDDCTDALDEVFWDVDVLLETASSEYEARAMKRFIALCKRVANEFEDEE